MLDCEKAKLISTKEQYKEASLWEKLKCKMHLGICNMCTAFEKKNNQLTTLCDKAQLHGLSKEEKESMKKEIQEQL